MVEMEDSFAVTNDNPNASPNANANANDGNSPELPPWREVDINRIGSKARPIVVDDDGDDDNFDASTVDGDDASRGDGASRTPDRLRGHAVHASELSPGDQVRPQHPGLEGRGVAWWFPFVPRLLGIGSLVGVGGCEAWVIRECVLGSVCVRLYVRFVCAYFLFVCMLSVSVCLSVSA